MMEPDRYSEVGHILIENEKVHRKLRKVQQRRDHYAKLYYKTLAELDESKWELSRANNKIKEFHEKYHDGDHRSVHHSGSNVTTPDSGTSLSPTIAPLNPSDSIPYKREFTLPPAIPITKAPRNNEQPHRSRPVDLLPHFRYDVGPLHRSYSSKDQLSFQPSIHGLHHQPNVYKYEHFTFARPYSLSQGDNLALDATPSMNILSQDVQTPLFSSKRMSLPYHIMTSRSESASQTHCGDLAREQSNLTTLVPNSRHPYSPSKSSKMSASTVSKPYSSTHVDEAHYQSLSKKKMLDILTYVSFPQCCLRTLEIARSQLGDPEAMQVFCMHLLKNTSIISLSLPNNDIGQGSLAILLDSIKQCPNMKELLLRNNKIGVECAELIKNCLSQTTLDSLVLTGNEIEQYSHILSEELPQDFSMEYGGSGDSSIDSGVVSKESVSHSRPRESDIDSTFKYLHI